MYNDVTAPSIPRAVRFARHRPRVLRVVNKRLKERLADEVLDHKIDEVALRIAYRNLGTTPDELKKKNGMSYRLLKLALNFKGVIVENADFFKGYAMLLIASITMLGSKPKNIGKRTKQSA